MKANESASPTTKRIIYYLDESIVFIVTVLSVMFSDILQKSLQTGSLSISSLHNDWGKLILSCIITIMIYGSMNESFKYSEKDKPTMFKRIYQGVLQGIAWKTIIGFV